MSHNVCCDYLRSQKSKRGSEIPLDKFYALSGNDTDIYNKLEEDELGSIIRSAMEDIPEKLRMIIVYYDMRGMSYNEIAEIIKKPIGTVKSRLNRGRDILRNRLRNILCAGGV